MKYKRMPIEIESPEEMGYHQIKHNLAESSVRDIYFKDLKLNLDDLFLCYGEHRGDSKLRDIIVKEEKNLNQNHVLVCPSAATALFIVSTTLLNEKDHLIVLRPNYATNIETPRAINSEISYVELTFENEFLFEVEDIKKLIKPNTKLISITNPHNPTAVIFDDKKIKQLITLAEEREIYLLVDETYRYLNFQSEIIPYYANESDRVISVCSISKAFGVPGIRIGWLITQNQSLMHNFLAAKEQIIICNSVVDEAIALHILENKDNLLPSIHKHIKTNFEVLQKWMENQDYMEWIEPKVGVVCFPRIKLDLDIDLPKFYKILFEKYATIVGPGHWFEQLDRYMRIGFGYPLKEEFENGLENLKRSIEEARR